MKRNSFMSVKCVNKRTIYKKGDFQKGSLAGCRNYNKQSILPFINVRKSCNLKVCKQKELIPKTLFSVFELVATRIPEENLYRRPRNAWPWFSSIRIQKNSYLARTATLDWPSSFLSYAHGIPWDTLPPIGNWWKTLRMRWDVLLLSGFWPMTRHLPCIQRSAGRGTFTTASLSRNCSKKSICAVCDSGWYRTHPIMDLRPR